MIRIMRGLVAATAAAAALLPLSSPASAAEEITLPLREAVAALPTADEDRTGYNRDLFRHWVDEDRDGCNTRMEVLIAEAVEAPAVGPRCVISGGRWYSYYDDVYVDGPRGNDIDHMVPLAEAWDSGASGWTAARRQAYANDVGSDVSLIAVTARSNRSKADQDPAEWMPPSTSAYCQYLGEWVATKLRWQLAVDNSEAAALAETASRCPDVPITYTPA